MTGFGSQPFGSSPYGVGTPIATEAPGGVMLRDAKSGGQHGSRRIDPITRDYVVDEHGRAEGMSDAQHLVYMAVATKKGRSAMRALGLDLDDVPVVDASFERRAELKIQGLLEHLTSRNIINIVSVTPTQLHPGAARLRLVFRDVATNTEHPLEI